MRRLPGLNRRRAILAGLLAVVMSMGATAAWAYWLTSGVGSGFATTGSLAAPTNPTATYATGASSVSVSWTASAGSPAPTGYFVTRIRTSDSATSAACGTSPTSMITAVPCTDSAVPDGTYQYRVTAVYRSWTATSGLSNVVTVAVATATTTTTALSSSSNPSVVGQTVTYTATVTPSGSTGTVTFKDGAATITCTGGSQTLSSGLATCLLVYTAVGPHSITAVYNGDATHLTSTSTALSQTVNQASTTATLVANPTSSVTGQSVTLTATVTVNSPGTGTLTGTVTFSNNATTLCNAVALNASGVATCATTALPVGNKTLSAVYSGSPTLAASTGTASQTTTAASTTTSLASSANPAGTGTTVTYTATVTAVAPGSGVPTGTVTFKDGTSDIPCTGGSQTLSGSGVATCQISYPSVSSHTITAVYATTTNYLTSTSSALTQKAHSSAVVGLAFVSVTVDGSPTTVTCTGVIGTTYTCTVPGTHNKSLLAAKVAFVNSVAAATIYSVDDQQVSSLAGGVTIPGNASTSTTSVSATQNGSSTLTITVTSGAWTAVLKMS